MKKCLRLNDNEVISDQRIKCGMSYREYLISKSVYGLFKVWYFCCFWRVRNSFLHSLYLFSEYYQIVYGTFHSTQKYYKKINIVYVVRRLTIIPDKGSVLFLIVIKFLKIGVCSLQTESNRYVLWFEIVHGKNVFLPVAPSTSWAENFAFMFLY